MSILLSNLFTLNNICLIIFGLLIDWICLHLETNEEISMKAFFDNVVKWLFSWRDYKLNIIIMTTCLNLLSSTLWMRYKWISFRILLAILVHMVERSLEMVTSVYLPCLLRSEEWSLLVKARLIDKLNKWLTWNQLAQVDLECEVWCLCESCLG